MKISVISADKYLLAQAELVLSGKAEVCFSQDGSADITLWDTDTAQINAELGGKIIRLSRHSGEGNASIPLSYGFYSSLLSEKSNIGRLVLISGKRECTVDGKAVKLTAHEYALLSLLVSKNGGYATREEISDAVFGGGSDNMINLYVHYLREKLESGSEKIILSSRKQGYALNTEFLGGKIC